MVPLALTLSARAASLSAPECLVRQRVRRAPISSTRLIRALSLAALRRGLAWTWGVGGRQGRKALVAEGRMGVPGGAGAQDAARVPWLRH